jgi:hypothetical protein
MDAFRLAYSNHAFMLWLLLLVLIALMAIWLWQVQRRARNAEHRLDTLLGGVSDDGVGHMLAEYLAIARGAALSVNRIKQEHDDIASIMPSVIRHVGLVRFSPFHDTGGDQSFALALLDGRGDGVVLTALHSRAESRLYAKPIEGGASSYSLTPEEREAMDRAWHAAQATVSR